MTVHRSGLLERTGAVRAVFSTRVGGASPEPFGMNLSFRVGDDPVHVEENRRRLLAEVGATPADLAFPGQVHECTVRFAGAPGAYPSTDALVTTVPGVVLGVTVADCVPVLLADPGAGVAAAVHAGWRGMAGGILGSAVDLLVEAHGCSPARLCAAIGPSAGVCCYEVGEEVAVRFSPDVVVRRGGRAFLDLRTAACALLASRGLPQDRIELLGGCTICAPALYHSHRRDRDRSGRMMALVRLVPLRG
jgi:hypothetical protein